MRKSTNGNGHGQTKARKFYPPKARVQTKGLKPKFVRAQREWWEQKSRRAQLAYLASHPCSVYGKRYGVKAA